MLNEIIFTMKAIQKKFTSIFYLVFFATLIISILFKNFFLISLSFLILILTISIYLRYTKFLKFLYSIDESENNHSIIVIYNSMDLFIKFSNFSAPTNCIVLSKNICTNITVRCENGNKVSTSFTPVNDKYEAIIEENNIIFK